MHKMRSFDFVVIDYIIFIYNTYAHECLLMILQFRIYINVSMSPDEKPVFLV